MIIKLSCFTPNWFRLSSFKFYLGFIPDKRIFPCLQLNPNWPHLDANKQYNSNMIKEMAHEKL